MSQKDDTTAPHPNTSDELAREKLPEPEVLPKPTRRKLTAAFKLRVLQELDELKGSGQIGAYLREHGLYSAQVSTWRQALADGGPVALEPKRRGRPCKTPEMRELRGGGSRQPESSRHVWTCSRAVRLDSGRPRKITRGFGGHDRLLFREAVLPYPGDGRR